MTTSAPGNKYKPIFTRIVVMRDAVAAVHEAVQGAAHEAMQEAAQRAVQEVLVVARAVTRAEMKAGEKAGTQAGNPVRAARKGVINGTAQKMKNRGRVGDKVRLHRQWHRHLRQDKTFPK
jgi:hypothetical protein